MGRQRKDSLAESDWASGTSSTARTGRRQRPVRPIESATPGRLSNYASGLDIKCRRNRTGRGPWRVRAIAFDSPRHPLPVGWNTPVADIARPRIDDVGGGVHISRVAGAGDDGIFSLEI